MQWNAAFGLVLLGVTGVTYLGARVIEARQAYGRKKYLIWTFAVLALVPLLVFKYYNFITRAGASALQWIGIDSALPGLNWVVPLGLSFYTFQAVGYVCDVYRQKVEVEHGWWDYMLFVAFFPQILCGPISKASDLLPQIKNPSPFDYGRAVSGLRFLLWGMFLKLVVADRLGLYVDAVYKDYTLYSGTSSLLASIFYSLQIYGDFAGYSYMAVGVGRLFGYSLIVNFNRPYFATSVSQFWKRWNISLTKWLTSYVYIPLGGSRTGRVRTYRNILVTFLVSGIWHGANWTFILWGAIHGVAQCVEKFFGLNSEPARRGWTAPRIALTFTIVNFAWIFFRMPSISEGWGVIRRIFINVGAPLIDGTVFVHLAIALSILFFVETWMEYAPQRFKDYLGRHLIVRWCGYVGLTMTVLLFGVLDSGQFIYVSF